MRCLAKMLPMSTVHLNVSRLGEIKKKKLISTFCALSIALIICPKKKKKGLTFHVNHHLGKIRKILFIYCLLNATSAWEEFCLFKVFKFLCHLDFEKSVMVWSSYQETQLINRL